MATLTVTATLLGSYSSKVTAIEASPLNATHVLHGLGATPTDIYVTLRSAHFSVPCNVVLGSYDMTMAYLFFQAGAADGGGDGQIDAVFRRVHSIML